MNRKLKIAWLTSRPSGDQLEFFKALARLEEIDFTVLYCSSTPTKGRISVEQPSGRGLRLRGIGVHVPGGSVFVNPAILVHILTKRYDLMVIGGYIHPTMLLAMTVRSIQGRPWALFAERPGMSKNNIALHIYRSCLSLLLKRASAVIATGSLAQRAYQTLCGQKVPVYSIPYLVDLNPFLQLERTVYSKKSLRFLFCGQLIHRKGVDTLITAFGRLAYVYPQLELRIVGDGPEMAKLKLMVPSLLKDRVVFQGVVPFESRNTSFQEADILVHPARHDGWGIVVQEAMAAGLPVIGTKETGAAFDLVDDGKNGFLVNADDDEALFQRMKWFVDHPGELSAFAHRAREKVSRYTPAWGVERLREVARGIIGVPS